MELGELKHYSPGLNWGKIPVLPPEMNPHWGRGWKGYPSRKASARNLAVQCSTSAFPYRSDSTDNLPLAVVAGGGILARYGQRFLLTRPSVSTDHCNFGGFGRSTPLLDSVEFCTEELSIAPPSAASTTASLDPAGAYAARPVGLYPSHHRPLSTSRVPTEGFLP